MATSSVAVNLVARQWSPYKDLYNIVDAAITQKTPDSYYDLEVALRKYKPDFISLLKNPAKNSQHREKVKKAHKDGIVIEGQTGTRTLPTQFIEESLIISDLFDLNEYSAVELLLAGEQQQPHYPTLPRGLVAILLYYDGRRSIVNALHLLIQSRKGRTWTLELDDELMLLTTNFTNELVQNGLVGKVLQLLLELLPEKEIEKLAKQRAIGGFKHRHQVMELLKEIRLSLADCLFSLSCQSPFDKSNTIGLMKYLKKNAALNAEGALDDASVTLLTTFMYCAHVNVLDTDTESRNDIMKSLPCITDPSYIPEIQQDLISEDIWAVEGVKSVIQFVWAVMLRNIAQHIDSQGLQEHIEADEMLVEMALEGEAFKFILNIITKKENFHDSEFQVRRFHALVTDFIIQMPLKIKELRNRGDEAARILLAHTQEGLEPPANLPRHFEHFMRLISALYSTDPLNLELAADYWCPSDQSLSPSRVSYLAPYRHRPSNRQVSLFKFIRMAGDLLPPSLYVPYIAMLTGLATGPICAHHCFNLLKVNGLSGGGSVTSVSWDHFFQSLSRYYSNLRQENGANVGGQTYRQISGRGITPQEIDGLVTVLRLVQTVAEWDEEARIGLCENQAWLPIVLLFGIITCSVPPLLKSECLKALATFAKTPELAANLWQALENSQVLPTLDRDSSTGSGIPLDLEIVECRNEEFPLTLGFLEFISCLVHIPIPNTLGAGLRAPGFDPYLEFLRDQVFLKFHTRAYRDTKEKWEVASKCLKIFLKLLHDHNPSIEDFMDQILDIQGGGKTIANKPAGHHLMLHMLNDSHLLKLILFIIHEARRLLDQYKSIPGKEHLETAALYCLKMIDIAMEKQEEFFDLVRSQSLGVMVTPMDQLLMSINPKTGNADHLVNVAKFVSHATEHPEHALVAVKVLFNVVKTSNIQSQIVGLFTVNETVSKELVIGFVDCLETDEHEEDEGDIPQISRDTDSLDVVNIRNTTRLFILRLLLFSLGQPAPNLTHFFLGFDIRKQISKSSLQDPGVLGAPRTCLHSILSILEKGITKGSGLTSIHTMPKLADLCYEMVYQLCSNSETSISIMRYLGMTHNFFYRHLRHVPFLNGIGQNTDDKLLLNQQAWLLKSVAVEIRLTSVNRQRSYTQRLLKLLLEDVPSTLLDRDDNDENGYGETNQSILETTAGQQVGASITGMQVRRKILQILDSIDLTQDYPGIMQLDLLEPTITDQLIKACEKQTESGMTVCNIYALHRELMGRLNAQQGPAIIGNRPRILQEIQEVLKNVVECNLSKEMAAAKRHALDAWRQVVEIMFASCSQDLLPLDTRETILLELIQELLNKVADDAAVAELTAPVSGILISLMTNLHQCAVIDQSKSIPEQLSTQYVHMLDGSIVHGTASTFGSAMSATVLTEILRKLITFLVQSTTGQLRVRSNLYGTLMNFLQMPQKVQEIPTLKGRNVLDSQMLTEYDKMTASSLAVIAEFGDSLMELVCRDACDGHDVGRMLALSLIDSILAIDKQHRWLNFLNSKGYLRHLIESLVQEDESLQDMLKPTPEPLRALYIYESKMSLLTRLGETPIGAEALLQQGIMGRLSECQFLELRPERDISRRGEAGGDGLQLDAFIPTVLHRYRQLLFPVLRLCVAIMTSLGGQHKEAANQILRFVFSHSELFTAILRDHPSRLSVEAFQELSLTTAVICRTAADVDYYSGSPYDEVGQSQLVVQGHLSRIQRQILALVPRYCIHDHWNKRLKLAGENEIKEEDKEKIRLTLLEINSNIITYCRSEVTSTGVTGGSCTLLFTPSLSEALTRDYHQVSEIPMASISATKPPSLGLIVRHLRQVANTFLPTLDSHQQMLHKLSNITELSAEELKELIKPVVTDGVDKLSASYRQQLACQQIAETIRIKAKELALKYYTLENCLFLIWRHLEYYLIHCQPSDSNHSMLPPLISRSHQARDLADPFSLDRSGINDRTSSLNMNQINAISKADIQQLKEEAVTCLTESLLQKFRDMEAQYGKTVSRYSFVSVLARRIHRLLTIGIQADAPIR